MTDLAARRTDRSTKAALERVLQTCLQDALTEISEQGTDASLHDLRKRSKELRGLLQLLRPGLPAFRPLNAALRDAAQQLAPARDAEAMLAGFDAITAVLREPARFDGLRRRLIETQQQRRMEIEGAALKQLAEVLTTLQRELAQISLSDKANLVVWNGLHRTWGQARNAWQKARASFGHEYTAAPFHDWRKALKRHWYQARFLAQIRPKSMARHIARIDALTETLGDHNDLDVLIAFLDAQPDLSPDDAYARELFRRHATARRYKLARAALDQARPIMGRPADALAGEWRGWWQRWRKG
ncbi:CHAD domain-containing protein [Natronohydrobacter thiooxidans]|uniref:CHAD domain-containing protein n=1 Tax=Natronohydrobacter thiooxidans TaxID=87172 RepID=UPI0008FF7773|nr:CHAD domain-containing protein [Natronohydrobacter thiooxidans]